MPLLREDHLISETCHLEESASHHVMYERLRSRTDLSTIDLTEYSLHVTNNLTRDQKRHNSDFIADLRSTYTDYLLRAKAAGTLATLNNEE